MTDRTGGHPGTSLPFVACVLLSLAADGAEGAAGGPTERHAYLMGTEVAVQVWAPDGAEGMRQSEAMLQELLQAETWLTTWRTDGAIGRLNVAPLGATVKLDEELCELVERLRQWWTRTGGAFDPLLGSLIQVWDLRGLGRIPEAKELESALRRSGFTKVSFDRDRCTLARQVDVLWDSGGFGKGAALDRLLEMSRERNWAPWLIDLGGQIAVFRPPERPFRHEIAIADPLRRGTPLGWVTLDSGSLAVSGGSERDLQVGSRRVGHILDPRTGFPAATAGAVAVWSESALDADIASTALYVMGREVGLNWAEVHGLAACFIDPGSPARWNCSETFIRRLGFPRSDLPN